MTKKHFEINKFDGVGIQLVLPHSRTRKKKEILHRYTTSAPAVPHSEKKKEILHRYTTSSPAVPHSHTRLMDYRKRYINGYRMQIFVDCGTAGAEH